MLNAPVTTLVAWAILVAFSAAGVIQLVRVIPWVERQMLAGKKPWVCDLCMSWWTTGISLGLWTLLAPAAGLTFFPAFGLTLLLTRSLGAPTSELRLDDIPEIKEDP
jgi:hypothetical protein